MLVEKPNFKGVINPKTYLNHDLGSKFFFLSDLAYKLVNLLVFEKFPCKISKNWTFQKIIGLGLNFTYEFGVCFKGCIQLKILVVSRLGAKPGAALKKTFINNWLINFMIHPLWKYLYGTAMP